MICGMSVSASIQRFCLDWFISFFFIKLSMLLEAHVVLHVTARFFEKNSCPKNGENMSKWVFLSLFKNLGIEFF